MHRLLLLLLTTALLAGCVDDSNQTGVVPTDETPPDETSMPGNGFAPQTGHQENVSGDLSLVGNLHVTDCDAVFCIQATATNEGSSSYQVSSICVSPWSESMQQGQASVQKSQPMATCLAFGLKEFPAGSQLEANFTWDGTLWDEEAGEYRDAPRGAYTWAIHFQAYESADGRGSHQLQIDFPVIIGET